MREGKADSLELGRADAMMELILEHSDVKVVIHATRAADEAPAAAPGAPASAGGSTSTPGRATASASEPSSAGTEDLLEVGGLGLGGTTFVRRDWLDNAGTTDSDRELTCDTTTGALLHGDVPAALARGNRAARGAHRAAERSGKDLDELSQSYRVPDGMARLIRVRDGSCRFPGCAVPARQCDLDHVRPWPVGPTTPTNLMALCRHHHRIKQRHGWTVKLHPDATVTWTDPTRRQTATWPVDHLHLITAGHTHRDPSTSTASSARADAADIPTTFEEQLADLLDSHDLPHHPRTHPTAFDLDGNTTGGPPPSVDLDHSPTWHRYEIDFPPRPPRPPEPIPF